MGSDAAVRITPFEPRYQQEARCLVLEGLAQRWGKLDNGLNRDLDSIAESYAGGHFLLALRGQQVIGTGALLPESPGVMRIVRMSTHLPLRGRGIGTKVLAELIRLARRQECHQVVLETTADWHDAVRFYLNRGFRFLGERNGDAHFVLDLDRVADVSPTARRKKKP